SPQLRDPASDLLKHFRLAYEFLVRDFSLDFLPGWRVRAQEPPPLAAALNHQVEEFRIFRPLPGVLGFEVNQVEPFEFQLDMLVDAAAVSFPPVAPAARDIERDGRR